MSAAAKQGQSRARVTFALAALATWWLSWPAYAEWPDLLLLDPVILEKNGKKDAALIVGIEQYSNLTRIPGARDNAEAWRQFFLSSVGIQGRNVEMLTNSEAKDFKIRATLKDTIKRAQNGGRIWFVFIGHGAPSSQRGDGLLAGADADATAEGLEQRSLHRSELVRLLGSRARDNVTGVAIIDACFSGRSDEGEPLVEGLMPVAIVDKQVPARVLVMTAAGGGEFAGPLPAAEPKRPAFSYLMLGALRGWADANKDGSVTAQEAVDYSNDILQRTLRGDRMQHPTLDAANPDLVLTDGNEPAPKFDRYPEAEAAGADESATPSRFAGRWSSSSRRERDTGEPEPAPASDDGEALVHGIGSVEVGIGGGAPYDTFALYAQASLGMRFGDYVRLSALLLGSAANFSDTNTTSQNPSPRPTFGLSVLGALGFELARTRFLSMSADALGGLTHLGERCVNPVADGVGNLICDRVLPSELGPAAGVRLAAQVRMGSSQAALTRAADAHAQGLLISGTALTSNATGWFGGVFLGYGVW